MARKVIPTEPGTGKPINEGFKDINDNFTENYQDITNLQETKADTTDVDTKDAQVLLDAKAHANSGDVTTLQAAKDYTDAELGTIPTIIETKADTTYVDAQDNQTLVDAKAYTDAELGTIPTIIETKADTTYVDAQDAQTLVDAKAYTDAEIAAIPEVDISGKADTTYVDNRFDIISSNVITSKNLYNGQIEERVFSISSPSSNFGGAEDSNSGLIPIKPDTYYYISGRVGGGLTQNGLMTQNINGVKSQVTSINGFTHEYFVLPIADGSDDTPNGPFKTNSSATHLIFNIAYDGNGGTPDTIMLEEIGSVYPEGGFTPSPYEAYSEAELIKKTALPADVVYTNSIPSNIETLEGAQTKATAAETAAKDYADSQDATVLVDAKAYTDAEIAAIPPTDISSKANTTYVDSQDAATLADAKAYTDTKSVPTESISVGNIYDGTVITGYGYNAFGGQKDTSATKAVTTQIPVKPNSVYYLSGVQSTIGNGPSPVMVIHKVGNPTTTHKVLPVDGFGTSYSWGLPNLTGSAKALNGPFKTPADSEFLTITVSYSGTQITNPALLIVEYVGESYPANFTPTTDTTYTEPVEVITKSYLPSDIVYEDMLSDSVSVIDGFESQSTTDAGSAFNDFKHQVLLEDFSREVVGTDVVGIFSVAADYNDLGVKLSDKFGYSVIILPDQSHKLVINPREAKVYLDIVGSTLKISVLPYFPEGFNYTNGSSNYAVVTSKDSNFIGRDEWGNSHVYEIYNLDSSPYLYSDLNMYSGGGDRALFMTMIRAKSPQLDVEVVQGKNLIDFYSDTSGGYKLNTTTGTYAADSDSVIAFVDVEPENYYYLSGRTGADINLQGIVGRISFGNHQKIVSAIGDVVMPGYRLPNENGSGYVLNGPFKVPAGVNEVIFNIIYDGVGSLQNVMLEKIGPTYDPDFIPSPFDTKGNKSVIRIAKESLPNDVVYQAMLPEDDGLNIAYVDSGDTQTLVDAKTYSDSGDTQTLVDAKAYYDRYLFQIDEFVFTEGNLNVFDLTLFAEEKINVSVNGMNLMTDEYNIDEELGTIEILNELDEGDGIQVSYYGRSKINNGPEEFVTVWRTTTSNEPVKLPIFNAIWSNYADFNSLAADNNFTLDWGDGTVETYTNTELSSEPTHTYATAGDHVVTITGRCEVFDIYWGDWQYTYKLIEVVSWGNVGFKALSLSYCASIPLPQGVSPLFSELISIEGFAYEVAGFTEIPEGLFLLAPKLENVSDAFFRTSITTIPENLFNGSPQLKWMYQTFYEAPVTSIPANFFDDNTALIDITYIFYGCTSLTGPAPQIWLREPPIATTTEAFYNCTGLSNYADIPVGYK